MYDGIDNKLWYDFGIPVYKIKNINDYIQEIKKLNVNLIIMCGWRQIICKELMNVPSLGIIGFHPTMLPHGRDPPRLLIPSLKMSMNLE